MRTTEKIMWLAVGIAVGAGVALLYAPQTGKDARKLIRRKAEDAKEVISETGERIGERIKDTLTETGETIFDAGKDAYRKSMSAAAGAAESAAGLFGRSRA